MTIDDALEDSRLSKVFFPLYNISFVAVKNWALVNRWWGFESCVEKSQSFVCVVWPLYVLELWMHFKWIVHVHCCYLRYNMTFVVDFAYLILLITHQHLLLNPHVYIFVCNSQEREFGSIFYAKLFLKASKLHGLTLQSHQSYKSFILLGQTPNLDTVIGPLPIRVLIACS